MVVSDSMGRSMTVRGKSVVLRTCLRNLSTRLRAVALQPAQTRQKITGLMARLLVEHGQGKASERVREAFGAVQVGEDGNV